MVFLQQIFGIKVDVWPGALRRLLRQWLPLDYWFLQGRAFLPARLSVDLTYSCNACCKMCCRLGPDVFAAPTMPVDGAMLEQAAFESVCVELKRLRPTVYFTGGEPLLHPKVAKFISFARALGFYSSINTNGILLEERAVELVQAGVNKIILSVAPAPDLCLQERGVSYERLQAGVREIRSAASSSHEPVLSLSCVVTPSNCNRLAELADVAHGLNVSSVTLQHLMFSDEQHVRAHAETLSSMFAEKDSYSALMMRGGSIDVAALGNAVQALHAAGLRVRLEPEIPESAWPAYYASVETYLPGRCLAPWTTLVVMPDGGLSCCRPLLLGRAGTDTVRSVWNNSKAVAFRRYLKRRWLPGCARCCARTYGK